MKNTLKKSFTSAWIMLFTILSLPAFSKNMGVVGQTYLIQETNFLEFIQARLEEMKKSGQLNTLENKLAKRAEAKADRPSSQHLLRASTNKNWNYDPSITLSHDLSDGVGRVFAKANTSFNPLNRVPLSTVLIFYDADDEKQLQWVKHYDRVLNQQARRDTLILINGSVSSQIKIFNRAIYFDQQGRLTDRFKIQHVPAIVEQAGSVLSIREVKL